MPAEWGRDAAGKSPMRRAMASQENKILAAIDRAARDGERARILPASYLP